MVFHPLETLAAVAWTIGVFAVVDGVLLVLQALIERPPGATGWQLLVGLVVIGLGVLVMSWPKPTVLVLFYVVTAWILVVGVVGVVAAVVLRKHDDDTSFPALAIGLVNLAIGLLLAFNPQQSLAVGMVLFGVFALVAGVLLVVSAFAARSLSRRLEG
ncbi:DUF308 domain-containing protein [Cellulomonas palmilytica]|nr:DUF308 domain-containing protein [Cellulomonas palmilytica]